MKYKIQHSSKYNIPSECYIYILWTQSDTRQGKSVMIGVLRKSFMSFIFLPGKPLGKEEGQVWTFEGWSLEESNAISH